MLVTIDEPPARSLTILAKQLAYLISQYSQSRTSQSPRLSVLSLSTLIAIARLSSTNGNPFSNAISFKNQSIELWISCWMWSGWALIKSAACLDSGKTRSVAGSSTEPKGWVSSGFTSGASSLTRTVPAVWMEALISLFRPLLASCQMSLAP